MIVDDCQSGDEHFSCVEQYNQRDVTEKSPLEWYASLLAVEANRHKRLREMLQKRLQSVWCLTHLVNDKASDLSISSSRSCLSLSAAGSGDSVLEESVWRKIDGGVETPLTREWIVSIASEYFSAEAARKDVVTYISSLPTYRGDLITLVEVIQKDKLRKMEGLYALLDMCFRRMIMLPYLKVLGKSETGLELSTPDSDGDGVSVDCFFHDGEVGERAKFFLSTVPELLSLSDELDTCLLACQSTRQKLQKEKSAVCKSVELLAMRRRHENLVALVRMVHFIEERRKETWNVYSLLKAGRFVEAVRLLQELQIVLVSVTDGSILEDDKQQSEQEVLEMMCGATITGAIVLKEHRYLCTHTATVLREALHSYLSQLLNSLRESHFSWSKDLVCSALRVVYGAHTFCSWTNATACVSNSGPNDFSGHMTAGRLIEACVIEILNELVTRNINIVDSDDDIEEEKGKGKEEEEEEEGGVKLLAGCVSPLEVRRITLQLLSQLSSFIRATFFLQRFFETLASTVCYDENNDTDCLTFEQVLQWFLGDDFTACETLGGNMVEFSSVFVFLLEAFKDCCNIGLRAAEETVQIVLIYQSYLPLDSVTVPELFLTYRLLFQYMDICRPALQLDTTLLDEVTAEMEARLASLVGRNFARGQIDTLVQLLRNDIGQPVRVVDEDFPPLYAFVPCEEESTTYLVVPPGRFCYDVGEAEVRYVMCETEDDTVALNPFFGTQTTLRHEAVPADEMLRLKLLSPNDALNVLTFSGLMSVKMMVENTLYVQMLRRASLTLVHINLSLAALYVWFIISYFVSSDSQWLFCLTAANADLKQFADLLQNNYIPKLFDWRVLESSPCLAWRSVSNSRGHLFAALERATGLCSVTTIGVAFKATISSLTALLPADRISHLASVKMLMVRLCKFVTQHGLHVLSTQILSLDSFAFAIEQFSWDGSAEVFPAVVSQVKGSSSFSLPVRQTMDAFQQCLQELRQLYCDGSSLSLRHLLDHIILNIFMGFVEGISRIRKLNQYGERQLAHDAEHICHEMFRVHPTLPRRPILHYVQRYTAAMTLPSCVPELVTTMHHLYTNRQLMVLTSRVGSSKRKDLERFILRMHTRDEIPFCLIEEAL